MRKTGKWRRKEKGSEEDIGEGGTEEVEKERKEGKKEAGGRRCSIARHNHVWPPRSSSPLL